MIYFPFLGSKFPLTKNWSFMGIFFSYMKLHDSEAIEMEIWKCQVSFNSSRECQEISENMLRNYIETLGKLYKNCIETVGKT